MSAPAAPRSKKHLENAATLREAMEQEEAEVLPDEAPADEDIPKASTDEDRHASSAVQSDEDDGASDEEEAVHTHGTHGKGQDHDRGAGGAMDSAAPGEPCSSAEEGSSEEESEADSEGSLDEDAMLARMLQAHARVKQRKQQSTARRRSDTGQTVSGPAMEPPEEAEQSSPSSQMELQQQPEEAVPPDEVARDDGVHANGTSQASSTAVEDAASADASGAGEESSTHPSEAAEGLHDAGPQQRGGEEPDSRQQAGRKPRSKKDRRRAQEAAMDERGLLCKVCKVQFETRNQLFKHIAAKGHAQLK